MIDTQLPETPPALCTECSAAESLPSASLLHEWSTGHQLWQFASDWFAVVGPDSEEFDLRRAWREWKPGRRSAWGVVTETAPCGCLVVHLTAA